MSTKAKKTRKKKRKRKKKKLVEHRSIITENNSNMNESAGKEALSLVSALAQYVDSSTSQAPPSTNKKSTKKKAKASSKNPQEADWEKKISNLKKKIEKKVSKSKIDNWKWEDDFDNKTKWKPSKSSKLKNNDSDSDYDSSYDSDSDFSFSKLEKEWDNKFKKKKTNFNTNKFNSKLSEPYKEIKDYIKNNNPDFKFKNKNFRNKIKGKIDFSKTTLAKINSLDDKIKNQKEHTLELIRKDKIGRINNKDDYANLSPAIKRGLTNTAKNNQAITPSQFEESLKQALKTQRNPDIAGWKKILRLEGYQLKNLARREGFKAHFTCDNNSWPEDEIGDTWEENTENILDMLFNGVTPYYQAHVSLETDIETTHGQTRNPHLYWGGQFALTFVDDEDDQTYNRFYDSITADKIRNGLTAAMTQVKNALSKRINDSKANDHSR